MYNKKMVTIKLKSESQNYMVAYAKICEMPIIRSAYKISLIRCPLQGTNLTYGSLAVGHIENLKERQFPVHFELRVFSGITTQWRL